MFSVAKVYKFFTILVINSPFSSPLKYIFFIWNSGAGPNPANMWSPGPDSLKIVRDTVCPVSSDPT